MKYRFRFLFKKLSNINVFGCSNRQYPLQTFGVKGGLYA